MALSAVLGVTAAVATLAAGAFALLAWASLRTFAYGPHRSPAGRRRRNTDKARTLVVLGSGMTMRIQHRLGVRH